MRVVKRRNRGRKWIEREGSGVSEVFGWTKIKKSALGILIRAVFRSLSCTRRLRRGQNRCHCVRVKEDAFGGHF